ncbi:MAG TPA: cytochrome P450 [Solirubrobacteraceae bacterium]|nr:cytochrome P450 [Solirubrobacteraceae bacterium]
MRRSETVQLPPGPSVPKAVQMMATWTRPAASLERLRRYGKRITVRLPFQPPFVLLWDAGDIKEVFTAPPDVLHPGEGARILEPLIGRNSVILLDEDDHLEQRRLLLPAFHGERMQRLTGLMTELAEREVASWPTDEPVALHPRLQRVTLEIILQVVFGLEEGPTLDRLRHLLTEVLGFTESPLSVLPPLQRLLRWTPIQRRFQDQLRATDEIIFALIEERRGEMERDGDGSPRDDILAMLLAARHQDQTPMSEQELRDELMTALVAGHETTASQLAWALERLAREPAVRARLTDELDAGESDEYLSATITEILRLRPVLPNAEPRLTKREVEIGGHRYPPGVVLMASAYLIHHDPDIYPEPHAFRPERFEGAAPGTYTWIPFGGGRRRCLGASFALQEMKVVLRATLRRYELTAASQRPEATRRRSITFSPAGGTMVVLRRRRVPAPAPEPATVAGAA